MRIGSLSVGVLAGLVAIALLVGLGAGAVQAQESAEVVDADPSECATLSSGADQQFTLTVDYDLAGKHPSHVNVGLSEDGYDHEVTEFDISDRGTNDRVTVTVDEYVGTGWEGAVASVSVYAEGEVSTGATDRVHYDVDGSTYTCDAEPEEVLVDAVDHHGDALPSADVRLVRDSDGEQRVAEANSDGFVTFDDTSFLQPGTFYVDLYPPGGYPPYYGYERIDLAEGETEHVRAERGGVYARDHRAIGTIEGSDGLQVQPGDSLTVDLDLYRPRHGDAVTVQTYLAPAGGSHDDVPDHEHDVDRVPSGESTVTVDVPAPEEPGTYDVRFELETTFPDVDTTAPTDTYDGPEFEVVSLEPPTVASRRPEAEQQTVTRAQSKEFAVDADSELTTDLDVVWEVDGSQVTTGETMVLDGAEYDEGEYEVTARISDGLDGTSPVTEHWTITVTPPDAPTLDRAGPDDETVDLRSGATETFAVDARAEHDGDLEYVWTQDGSEIGTGPEVERTFDRSGTYELTATVEDEWGQTETLTWTVEVDSFRSEPSVESTISSVSTEVGDSAEFVTVSVRNPDVNDRAASVEAAVNPPDGVEVRGVSGETTTGDAATRVLLGTIEPGEQDSMRLELAVEDEALDGQRVDIPVDLVYFPSETPDDYHTDESATVDVAVGDAPAADPATESGGSDDAGTGPPLRDADDASPGFSILAVLLALTVAAARAVRACRRQSG